MGHTSWHSCNHTTYKFMQRSIYAVVFSLWAGQCWAASADPSLLAACNAPAFQTVLQAAPSGTSSSPPTPQGVWLSRSLLQWPDAAMTGNFKLYHSA